MYMARKRFCTKNSLRCSHKSFGIAHMKSKSRFAKKTSISSILSKLAALD